MSNKIVNKSIRKKDSMALVTGKPVYTEDLEPKNALVVKMLRSPHAHAKILDINIERALKVEGIEAVYTHKDVPQIRFTMAGQSFPEPSPYDRLILDEIVRYVGDEVCIVAGENEKVVDKAMSLIKVKYEILDSIINVEDAMDNKIVIHSEPDYHVNFEIGNDVKRNICASGNQRHGDLEEAFANSDIVMEREYHTKANSQTMMEPFKTTTIMDLHGRLTVVSATQIPFHVRRTTAKALGLPLSKIKVVKPRIGGGFGAKQTMVTELFSAFVTLKTGKPSKVYYTRKESCTSGSGRHEMKIKVKIGASKDGYIQGIKMETLSNTGAYGEHGPTTVGLSASKTIPLYNKAKAFEFDYNVVYTNTMSAGAYRGYGATQGSFALESLVNELAHELKIDPIELRLKNLLDEGEVLPAYYNELLKSCALRECIETGKKMIGWDDKYPSYKHSNGKTRSVGMSITMQGSGISNIDVATAQIKLNDDGFYTLMIGATDMGTGCDTILSQMASECLKCNVDNIIVHGVDTDVSPYDTGSYASSTTYVTGKAVVKACESMNQMLLEEGAKALDEQIEDVEFDGSIFKGKNGSITLSDLAFKLIVGDNRFLTASGTNSSPVSPPPFMAGFVEMEIDSETGEMQIIDYVGVVDCGTPINPNLAKIQVEGGLLQGIGMALYEDIQFTEKGELINHSFMNYKIPSRLDVKSIRVGFESSFEPTGPFGAKSIGEVVINTPCPTIAAAIYNGTGVNLRELPMKQEDLALKIIKLNK